MPLAQHTSISRRDGLPASHWPPLLCPGYPRKSIAFCSSPVLQGDPQGGIPVTCSCFLHRVPLFLGCSLRVSGGNRSTFFSSFAPISLLGQAPTPEIKAAWVNEIRKVLTSQLQACRGEAAFGFCVFSPVLLSTTQEPLACECSGAQFPLITGVCPSPTEASQHRALEQSHSLPLPTPASTR